MEKIIKVIYKHRDIRFEFTNGGITSDDSIDKTNVCDKLYTKIRKYMDSNKLKKTDIWRIIQIFDTDGAYIPETAVINEESSKFVYSTTSIAYKDAEKYFINFLKSRCVNGAPDGFTASWKYII